MNLLSIRSFLWGLLVCISVLDAQEIPFKYNNSFYLEALGPGIYYSVNFETLLSNKNDYKMAFQIGINYYPKEYGITSVLPVSLTRILSLDNKNHVEIGLGIALEYKHWSFVFPENTYIVKPDLDLIITARIGYRFQLPTSKFYGRISYIQLWDISKTSNLGLNNIKPWGAIGIGYCF